MRVSFDLDDTLISCRNELPRESWRFLSSVQRRLAEPLRFGTVSLFNELKQRGHSLWIYTSSGRTPFQIKTWLWFHGLRVEGIVNEERHRIVMAKQRFDRLPSKFPPAFGIDLHVDNSEGVKMEGDKLGFQVLVVSPDDSNWAQRVLDAVTPRQLSVKTV